MPPDTFHDIVEKKALPISEICVAFPLNNQWQHLEEVATHDKMKRFIANPTLSPVNDSNMTAIQKFAVRVGKDENHQILFLCRRAGSGKMATPLKCASISEVESKLPHTRERLHWADNSLFVRMVSP